MTNCVLAYLFLFIFFFTYLWLSFSLNVGLELCSFVWALNNNLGIIRFFNLLV